MTLQHNSYRSSASFATVAFLLLAWPAEITASTNIIIPIANFGRSGKSNMQWHTKNDPVMGGQSSSTLVVEGALAKFQGEVRDVPSLNAPGFITMETEGGSFPDVSSCIGIDLLVRSNINYNGYRFSFGMGHAEGGHHAFGYKAPLDINVTDEFETIKIPFLSFSDKWSGGTGDIIVECVDDLQFCPTKETLKDMEIMQFWGEGVKGKVDLEVKAVNAYGCTSDDSIVDDDVENSSAFKEVTKSAVDGIVTIAEFSKNDENHMQWYEKNELVMEGESSCIVKVENGLGKFKGEVFAPGYITMETMGGSFPDVSYCAGVELLIRANVDYGGYRFSFGMGHADGKDHAFGYKAPFNIHVEDGFKFVHIPFSSFSDKWDDKTGDITTHCANDSRFCPTMKSLESMDVMQFWGEGTSGQVNLEIKAINAYGCNDDHGSHNNTHKGLESASTSSKENISMSVAFIALITSIISLSLICQMKMKKSSEPIAAHYKSVEIN